MKNKKFILIIDDDSAIAEVVKIILEEEGFKTLIDSKGDFFDKEIKDLPDLVLLDVLLTGKNGKDICKKIKNNPKTSKIPVIIISANTTSAVEKIARESKADGFITKPFEISELISVIKKHLLV